MREIEETVGTPYMGFNLGSTKVRQGHADDKPVRFIFESPLIRLMKDESYIDAYQDGDFVPVGRRVDSRSVWIFRYYEKDSESFGDGKKDPIESYADAHRRKRTRNETELTKSGDFYFGKEMGSITSAVTIGPVVGLAQISERPVAQGNEHAGVGRINSMQTGGTLATLAACNLFLFHCRANSN